MSRTLVLIFMIFLFASNAIGKAKGIFSLNLTSSTYQHSDPNEVVIFTGQVTSSEDLDLVEVQWIFEGAVQLVSGSTISVLTGIKANQPQKVEISARILNPSDVKIILSVQKEIGGAKIGQSAIYVPKPLGIKTQNFNKSSPPFKIDSKKIIY